MDILFNVALLILFVAVMWWCYESWQPKPYTQVHMRDFRKRIGR